MTASNSVTSSRRPLLYGRCLRGLEKLVARELTSELGARVVEVGHRELLFTWVDPTSIREQGLLDDLFVFCERILGICHKRSSLESLRAGVNKRVVSAIRHAIALSPGSSPRSLKVVASFLGKRNYNRFEIEQALGEPLAKKLGLKLVSSKEEEGHAVAVLRVHMRDSQALLAVRYFDKPLHRRPYKREHLPGATAAPLARAMARLAQSEPGMKILDPYCGTGTVLIEAGLDQDALGLWGSDISLARLGLASLNASGAGINIRWSHMSATALAFADNSFDRLVANVPWDRQVAHTDMLEQAWTEFARVIRPHGKVVVLLPTPEPRAPGFIIESRVELRLYGRSAWIVVLHPMFDH